MKKKIIRAEENTTMTISLPKEMAEAVKRYCDQKDIKASQYIRQLVRNASEELSDALLAAEDQVDYTAKKQKKKTEK